ncbi:MAG: HpcH/HpaI aldolase/citrate lyase family protein [Proteobacteria bacterium]|nr:HpcH/HpaI aldolase/citrate lyase family protein [Pseudomonadota bacterium]
MARLRRTMLFVPGGNDKLLTKGLELDVDSLILDLEDSVTLDEKASAREGVAEALRSADFGGKEKVVRINSLMTDYGKSDIAAVAKGSPDALLLPKVNRPEDILDYDTLVNEAEKREGISSGSIGLMALIETPLGIINIDAIASASSRMNGLLFGAADYTRETRGRITPGRLELYYPMIRILLAARVAGIDAIDTPYFDIKDIEGLVRHTQQARDMGYDGKAIIHPSQVEVVNGIFTPTMEEVTYAKRVIDAFEEAKAEGRGATQLDGQLIENVHVSMAQRILRIAEEAGLK